MATIMVTFQNGFGESRKWIVVDTGIDPNSPAVVFNDYLDADASTAPLSIYADKFGAGQVQYQRSDGGPQNADVRDGDVYKMQ